MNTHTPPNTLNTLNSPNSPNSPNTPNHSTKSQSLNAEEQTISQTEIDNSSQQVHVPNSSTIITQARIKNIMNTDKDTPKISKKGLIATTKATELFIQHLIVQALDENKSKGNKKRIDFDDIQNVIRKDPELHFLRDLTDKTNISRFLEE